MLFWLIWNWKSSDNQITEEKKWTFFNQRILKCWNIWKTKCSKKERKNEYNYRRRRRSGNIDNIFKARGWTLQWGAKENHVAWRQRRLPLIYHTHTRGRNVRKLYIWFEKSNLHLCMPMAFFPWDQFHENFSWKWFHGKIICAQSLQMLVHFFRVRFSISSFFSVFGRDCHFESPF